MSMSLYQFTLLIWKRKCLHVMSKKEYHEYLATKASEYRKKTVQFTGNIIERILTLRSFFMESIKITYLENKHTYPLICITVRLLVEIHGQCMQMVSCCFFCIYYYSGLVSKSAGSWKGLQQSVSNPYFKAAMASILFADLVKKRGI